MGVPGWSAFGTDVFDAEAAGAVDRLRRLRRKLPASLDDELVNADLTEDEQADRYRYRCPQTFRWKFVPAAEVAVYSVRPAAILSTIADLLGIARRLCERDRCAAAGRFPLAFGEGRIGPALTDVWLVRGLARSVEEVFRHFNQTSLPDQGLICRLAAYCRSLCAHRAVTDSHRHEELQSSTMSPRRASIWISCIEYSPLRPMARSAPCCRCTSTVHQHADHPH